ncbi:MAG: efflux RND transporter permease subunit [Acidobacteria bacterium]|nr:MAG: efflux RND transporter permease subunit [Acidobacteriota bacterium]
MNLSGLFIRRPIATALLMMALLVFGIAAYFRLPVSDLPNVDFPTIEVSAGLPGASAQTMASSVATPLEKQFSAIPGLDEMSSTSSQDRTSIALQFDLSRNIDGAASDVQTAIAAAAGQLPAGMPSPPTFRKVNPADSSVINIAISSATLPLRTVDHYAEVTVGEQISMIKGVAQVNVFGQRKFAVRIQLNPLAMAARGIGIDQVQQAIQQGNVNLPSGVLWGRTKAYTLQATGQLTSAAQYKNLIIAVHAGAPVRLQDIGDVVDSVQNDKTESWLNGTPTVMLSIMKQPGTNTIDVVNRIIAMLPTIRQSVPPSVQVKVEYNKAIPVESSISDVKFTLILAILLVVLVIFLFLKNFSATIIPSLALPFTIIGTFAVMYLLSYSLDTLSLLALTLSVGFVVDDAIVMLENIVRHMEMGKPVLQAAFDGSKEISFTILSMTLALTAVFIPFLFMGGVLGRLLHEFAVTIMAAILVSGFVSLTLTPMLCSRFLKHEGNRKHSLLYRMLEGGYQWMYRVYDVSLRAVLRHPALTMLGAAILLLVTVKLFLVLPTGFLPSQDMDEVVGKLQAAQGIPWPELKQKELQAIKVFTALPGSDAVMSFAGGNTGSIYDHLVPASQRKMTADEIIAKVRPELEKIPGVRVFLQNPPPIRIGAHSTNSLYQMALEGADPEELYHWAPILEQKLAAEPMLKGVNTDMQLANPQINVVIDRNKASTLGVSAESIENALYTAYGQRLLSLIYAPDDEYYVITELQPKFQINPQTLSYLYVHSSTGALVPLSAVTQFHQSLGPLQVNHISEFPAVTISFNLALGASLGPAVALIQQTAKQTLPSDISVVLEGTAQVFQQSMQGLGLLVLMAIAVIYIVLGILYESFIHPLTILSGLPAAAFGALLALWYFHFDLNIYSIVGIIMLIGIVKKNAIMMIDFALQAERDDGLGPRDSIYQGALIRFRPIMMTTFCALVGTLPIAVAVGASGKSRQPLGVAVVGGLVFAQFLTLYIIPVVYIYMDRFQRAFGRKKAPAPAPQLASQHQ